jgi:ABC-type antimicrobial peptide transport system permease subunit
MWIGRYWRRLSHRRARTLLTVVGIAVGIAAIVALRATADGFAHYYSLFGGSGADLLITQEESVDAMFSAIKEEVGEGLARLPEVDSVAGMLVTLAAVEKVPYFIVFGYDPHEFAIQHFKIVEGEGLPGRSADRRGKPLILGQRAAQNLELGTGDTLKLLEGTYRVVGIYETGHPVEESGAVISLQEAQAIAGKPRQVNAYRVKLRDLDGTEQARQRILRRFPDLTVSAAADFADDQEMLAYIEGFTWAVSLLAVLIGGIGVMNTMLMSVFERTREIGVLRALGWRRRRVLGMILQESLVLSLLGSGVGIALGIGLIRALARSPASAGILSGDISGDLILQALGVAFALGIVGGIYPAWRASRLVPLEALRSEGGAQNVAWAGVTRLLGSLPIGGMAARNLFRQRTRTLLTLVGLGMAITGIVLLDALTEGLVDQVSALAFKNEADLAAMEADASLDLSTLDERLVQRIAALSGVERAEGFLTGYAATPELPFFVVFGYHPAGQSIRHFRIVEGEGISANRQMMIGRVAAENLKKQVGETIRIFNTPFRVVGIYETGVPFEEGGGVIRLHDAQKLFQQSRKVSFVSIKVEDPGRVEEVRQRIEEEFPDVFVSMAADFAEGAIDIKATRSMAWAVTVLALIVGGVGMTNTMVMSVFERTREIGVLRALGWRRARVLAMIARESILLSLASALVGLLGGVVIGQILNVLPAVAGFLRLNFGPSLLARALVIALVLGATGGLYPAWYASRLQPLQALRYE